MTSQSIRSLRHWRCHDCTHIWSRQGESNCSHTRDALMWQTRGIRLFDHLLEQTGNPSFNLPFNAVRIPGRRIRGNSSWSESMADEEYEQIMLPLLVLVVYALCTWKPEADRWYSHSTVSGMNLYETGHSIQICVDRVMCLSEHSSTHVHACVRLFQVWLHEHRRSTLTQVPSQVSNHFAQVSSSWCRCVETPLVVDRVTEQAKLAQFLQDNFLLPDDFAEYIYHIQNAHEMHSIIQGGLIPGGKSHRRDRQSVFFTAVNSIDIQLDQGEIEYDLDKPRIAPYKHLENSSQYSILVQCKACSEKGIAILSNTTACNYSFRDATSDLYR